MATEDKNSEEPNEGPPSGCFLCGARNAPAPGYKGIKVLGRSFDLLFCASCGLGVTNPFLDAEELAALYSDTGYRAEDATRFVTPLEKLVARVRLGRVRNVERHARAKGRVLDVGCARGDFVALMEARGWKGVGLELDDRVSGRAARTGLDLRNADIAGAGLEDAGFDAVTFWHVFEHIRDPRKALLEAARVLRPGGLLVVAVPNIESLQARLTGRHWFHIDPPYHLYHYTPGNLERLLSESGFEVLDVRHFSFEYNPFGYLQSIYNAMGFRSNLLYDFLQTKSPPEGGSGLGGWQGLVLNIALLPLVAPVSLILSVVEALMSRGGTIEVYARKKRDRP